jgi:large subunit ribosomal protein L17
MRHGKTFNHLKRKKGHRTALLKNMACSLVEHKRIFTTLAKAKALRIYMEPLITKSKDNTTHSRRVVFSYLNSKEALKEMFDAVGTAVANRPGGYLRIIKMGFRQSDSAEMAMIEFVDFNKSLTSFKSDAKDSKTKKKSRRGGKKGGAAAVATAAAATTAATTAATAVANTATKEEE